MAPHKRSASGDEVYNKSCKRIRYHLQQIESLLTISEETETLSSPSPPLTSSSSSSPALDKDEEIQSIKRLMELVHSNDESFTIGSDHVWEFDNPISTIIRNAEENLIPSVLMLKEDIQEFIEIYNKQYDKLNEIKHIVRKFLSK